MFEDIKIEKNNFYHHKSRILLNDVDIEKLLVSKKISSSEKTINTLLLILKKNLIASLSIIKFFEN